LARSGAPRDEAAGTIVTLKRYEAAFQNVTPELCRGEIREDFMGLLDGLLGGTVGAALVTAATDLIEKNGGISGLAQKFQEQGLTPIIQSWISTGENQPIAPEQVDKAIGPDLISELAAKAGVSPEELRQKLAEILPAAVDKLTPEGKLPS
jgi:uncharacterized protein YidB (DUF937 family)